MCRQVTKKWRLFDIGRVSLPLEQLASRHFQLVPLLVSPEYVRIVAGKRRRINTAIHKLHNLLLIRPDVLEIYRLSIGIDADRVLGEVDVDVAGQCIGDDERW